MKAKNKPRVGVIGLKGLPAFGGAARVGENLIRELLPDFEFTVYEVTSHSNYPSGFADGIYHKVFGSFPQKKLNTLIYYLRSCLHAFFAGRYQIIHLHHRDAAFIMLLLRLRYPVVLTTHGSFQYLPKWKYFNWFFALQEIVFVRLASKVVCVSKNEVRKYKSKARIAAQYIPNGISGDDKIETPQHPKNVPYLFFAAGRIIQSKGLDTVLEALRMLEQPPMLVVAGDMEQTPDYRDRIFRIAQGLKVEFIGLIRNKAMLLGWIRHSELFLFPSEREAMSMMLLEAASVQAPMICSDIQENLDVLSPEMALYFKTGDEADLATKINWALKNKEDMQQRAKMASDWLMKEHSWPDIAKKYKSIFYELLDN